MNELLHIIKQKQALLARETTSCLALDYSEDMMADEQKRYINYLAERVHQDDLEKRAMRLVMQDFLDQKKVDEERLSKMDEILSRIDSLETELKEKDHKLKSSERKIADLTAKLKFANKNRFGSKSHSTKNEKNQYQEESDRSQDKDNFDGTSSSLPGNSVAKGAIDNSAEESANMMKTGLHLKSAINDGKTWKQNLY